MTAGPHQIIAIDGPAASGKSSVARALAQRLGFAYVNSGAMYRTVTWHLLQRDIDLEDETGVAAATAQAQITCDFAGDESRMLIAGQNPGEHLRDDSVNQAVSRVARVAGVRAIMVEHLRRYGLVRDLVMEGRDIGSVVFPHTPFKYYLDASPAVRMRRRQAQGERDEITSRDLADSSRDTAPLVTASDAEVIDTSHLSIPEVTEEILRRFADRAAAVSRSVFPAPR